MKKILYLGIVILLSPVLCAENNAEPTLAIEQSITQLETESNADTTQSNDQKEKPSESSSFFGSFSRFIRIFLILLNNQKVQNGAKTIEGMIISLFETAMQAIRATTVSPNDTPEDVAKKLLTSDPALKRSMIDALTKSAARYNPMPSCTFRQNNPPRPIKQADINAKIVLNNFAQIACHFINILQDPNNSENVTPNLMGMLGGIVNIGSQIMKSKKCDLNADHEAIKRYVEQLDPEFKQEFIETISRTIHRSYQI